MEYSFWPYDDRIVIHQVGIIIIWTPNAPQDPNQKHLNLIGQLMMVRTASSVSCMWVNS